MLRRNLFVLWIACALFICAGRALAWNPAGHMAISSVAYDRLTDSRRAELVGILRQHPRFKEDFASAIPEGLDATQEERWLFMRASIWPDLARTFPEPDRDTYNRPGWHYIDFPVYLNEKAREQIHVPEYQLDYRNAETEGGMNVVQALNKAVFDLNDNAKPQASRAVALCWVLHLASDIHQPLHGAALFSAGRFRGIPIGDKGGNDIPVHETEGILATYRTPNMHGLWDCMLGLDDSYAGVAALASKLKVACAESELEEAVTQMDVTEWARESNAAAAESVYRADVRAVVEAGENTPHAPLKAVEITADYLKAARPVAAHRAAVGAVRTAKLLDTPAK
jgi:hypothetical protein